MKELYPFREIELINDCFSFVINGLQLSMVINFLVDGILNDDNIMIYLAELIWLPVDAGIQAGIQSGS